MRETLKYIAGLILVVAVVAAWFAWSFLTAPPCSEARQGDMVCTSDSGR